MNNLTIRSLALKILLLFLNLRITIKWQNSQYHSAWVFSGTEWEGFLAIWGLFQCDMYFCYTEGRKNTFLLKSQVFSPELYMFLLYLNTHTKKISREILTQSVKKLSRAPCLSACPGHNHVRSRQPPPLPQQWFQTWTTFSVWAFLFRAQLNEFLLLFCCHLSFSTSRKNRNDCQKYSLAFFLCRLNNCSFLNLIFIQLYIGM